MYLRPRDALVLSSAVILCTALASSAAADTSSGNGAQDAVQTFANNYTGSCLDDSDAFGLRTIPCNGTSFQKWNVHVWNDATRELKNLATGRCLDDNGIDLRTVACNSMTYQSWFVEGRGWGKIALRNQFTNKCLDDSVYGLRTIGCQDGNTHQNWL